MSVAAAVRVGRRAEQLTRGTGRLPSTLAVLAFAVATAALLVTISGVHAFSVRDEAASPEDVGDLYVGLAFCAAGLLLAPVLTLGGVAARLTVGRRDRRLAALRLAGATRAQTTAITLVESGRLALIGAVAGVGLYLLVLPGLGRISFQGRPFGFSNLLVPLWWVPVAVLTVVALALLSGVLGLRRVSISPLGVAQRTRPPGMRVVRVVLTVVAGVLWLAVASSLRQAGTGVVMIVVAAMVGVLNLVGPFVMMLLGRLVAWRARTPQTLLAARRIVDDPKATWRSVGALGLAIVVAGVGGAFASAEAHDEAQRIVLHDMGTGALVTLGIIAVIAATSTGVVQAARVIDRRHELYALSLTGAEPGLLVRASRRETTLPLAITVCLAAVMCALLIVPFGAATNAGALVWLGGAIVGSVALMLASVTSTAPLVREAAAGTD
ncbi:hypothetical protein PZ938_18550 [Luteipulveratus sp. YIM 133132]|uniref:FtsX-like permease family protein n=1 Tax=Luteipulveratus flavus TaxID=3031728 RepID=UPI0023B1B6C0|nr:FtsX-like permease family protein [Luteipulveratus sp. YIM 133132]MDE9367621.1 hypothetical protein [Luteipulveratus sp. YIM 133132]